VVLGSIATIVAGVTCYGVVRAAEATDIDDAEYTQVCVDRSDPPIRVDDENCPDGGVSGSSGNAFLWWYLLRTHAVGSVGSSINPAQGSYVRPVGVKISTASRGGFGGRAASGGTGS
jgi:hypothetical protein